MTGSLLLQILHALNAILMIAMPIILAVILTRRWKTGWRVWWIGAATFVLSQIGHIPFNWGASLLLNQTGLVYWSPVAQSIFNAIFLGLSAGVFEEVARYLVLRFWAKDVRSKQTGILFGAGHGGAEAIIFGALAVLAFINVLVASSMDLSTVVSADQLDLARQQITAYWSTPWYLALFGAMERLFTIPVHICFALIVMQTFVRKQSYWLWLAVLLHAFVDASAVMASQYLGVYWTEALVGVFAILALIVIICLKSPMLTPVNMPSLDNAPNIVISPLNETDEKLDNTRYQ
jgi:uncharacterized membrane protein YhfC